MRIVLYYFFCFFLIVSCDNKSEVNIEPIDLESSAQSKVPMEMDTKNRIIQSVINGQKICGTPYNCFKPINLAGSKVKVLEIDIHSKTQASFATYDKDGNPVDLEDGFVIQIQATKEPPTLNADIIRK